MAYFTTHSSRTFPGRAFRKSAASLLVSLNQGFAASREFERLNRLSDTELARRGLDRQSIATHVLRTIFR